MLLAVAATLSVALTGNVVSAAQAAPAPPSGFTQTWADDFNGAAGTGVPDSLYRYDTGPGSGFGTGEIETMTNSTANVYYDGSGHLILKALHSGSNPATGWTSGRIETQASNFGAAPGGRGADRVRTAAAQRLDR